MDAIIYAVLTGAISLFLILAAIVVGWAFALLIIVVIKRHYKKLEPKTAIFIA